jgi:hypothetical protein
VRFKVRDLRTWFVAEFEQAERGKPAEARACDERALVPRGRPEELVGFLAGRR